MCWNDKTEMICKECNKTFFAEIGTLTIATKEYKKCPYCGKYSGEIKNNNILKG